MIDESILEQAKRMTWRAERWVHALKSGAHRSRLLGNAGEFAEHREYERGDDPRHIDWRAFARTGKPVLRRFEHAAERKATLVLDRSASMAWRGFASTGVSKQERAATLLLTLGLVLQGQGDRVGVVVLDETANDTTKSALDKSARNKRAHSPAALTLAPTRSRDELLRFAQAFVTPGGAPSVVPELTSLAEGSRDRHLLVVATDALDPGFEEEANPFAALLGTTCELHVLHVLHEDERTLSPQGPALLEGLEGESPLELELTSDVIERYQARLSKLDTALETHVTAVGGRLHRHHTGEDPVLQLAQIVTPRRAERRAV